MLSFVFKVEGGDVSPEQWFFVMGKLFAMFGISLRGDYYKQFLRLRIYQTKDKEGMYIIDFNFEIARKLEFSIEEARLDSYDSIVAFLVTELSKVFPGTYKRENTIKLAINERFYTYVEIPVVADNLKIVK